MSGTLWAEIDNFLRRMQCDPESVHLLVDFAYITDDSIPNLAQLCSHLPHLNRWQSFTVAAGSFPKDLTQWKEIGEYPLPRLEWQMWREQVAARLDLPRRPNYGDYGIYHPIIAAQANGRPSASVRYAGVEHWVIMRGRKIKLGGSQQYPAHAVALCERAEYVETGSKYSAGDELIAQMAQAYRDAPGHVKGTGNATTWLTAGFNRHLTLTARKTAALYSAILDESAELAA